jgi:hypothetical protein
VRDLIYPKSGFRASEKEFLAVALNLNDFHFIECRLIRLPLLRAERQKRAEKREREEERAMPALGPALFLIYYSL